MENTAPKKKSLAALAVASGILLSRIAGLIRGRVFAFYLGNSDAAGAFSAALRIPNLLQNLFGEGVLSASFIPVYARLLEEGKKEEAGKVAGITFSLLFLVVSLCVLVGVFASRPLIEILAPGFSGDVRELTIVLVQIMFPGMGLLVLSAWCLGILNSHRQFFLSYVAPVLWNVAMITLLLAVGSRYASDRAGQMELVKLVAWSTVVGAGLQLLVQVPTALRLNHGLKLGISLAPVAIVITNFLPAVLTRGVVQLSAYIDQILASYLGPHSVSAMAYAQTIYLLPISLFGMSISSAELPEMSRTLGTHDERIRALKSRLDRGLQRISFYIVPSVIAFVVFGNVIAATLLQTGHFTAADSNFVWMILIGSSVGMLATTQSRLCVSLFWALQDTKTPALFAFLRVVLVGLMGYWVVFPLRAQLQLSDSYCAAALVGSAGFAGWLEFLCIRAALARHIGHFKSFTRSTFLFFMGGLAGALVGLAVDHFLPPLYPALRGIIVLGAYGAVYLATTHRMGCEEAREALQPFKRRLGF